METTPSPSRALLAAALGGLLCVGTAACSSNDAGAGSSSGSLTCADAGSAGVVTSSTVVADMTLEKFTADCDTRGGKVELHSHCGGANSCRGMSYDEGTQTLTEHTCKGANTCAGYSCIICG